MTDTAPTLAALLPQALREQALPVLLIVAVTLLFMLLERIRPGRALPPVRGWYLRAAAMNAMQIALVGAGGLAWNRYFRAHTLGLVGPFGAWPSPVLEGFVYWLLGTFVFYWWHRLRHAPGFWQVFHQIHHSPSRIEVLTSFYKHPLEIAADSLLASALIYGLLGGSALAGAWTSFFGAAGEYFYHSNIRTPTWLGWFIQRPEHHAIHHQLGVHRHNFGDLTVWDRLFGTFQDSPDFADRCGFPGTAEERLGAMLVFRDVYDDQPEEA